MIYRNLDSEHVAFQSILSMAQMKYAYESVIRGGVRNIMKRLCCEDIPYAPSPLASGVFMDPEAEAFAQKVTNRVIEASARLP